MANEFKIKKGLIVTGASGGTVVDIQGSQGQLFSVTDDLSGSIFAVSDISGVPIFDVNSSGLSTFDGNVNLPDSKKILLGTGNDFQLYHDGTHGVLNNTTGNLYTSALGALMFRTSLNVTALTLDTSQNATFAGSLDVNGTGNNTFTGNILIDNVAPIIQTNSSNNASGFRINVTGIADSTNNLFRVQRTGTTMIDTRGNGNTTFTAQAFSAATSSGDASSTLTTKGYVDSLITGATIYRGTWQAGISATSTGTTSSSTTLTVSAAILDAAGNTPTLVGAVVTGAGITGTVKVASVTSSTVYELDTAISATATAYIFSPIYGAPDLSGVTQTSGYYYICSEAGSATPNGAGTEPNTWDVGDWVIWNDDVGASGEWQKVDNSSVLSGAGTGQTVALWEGPSSVTDSETLGNAPITVSGTGTTFAGRATFQSAVADRPQLPGGFLGMDTGDVDVDIWGVSRDYYPSNATAANAWGLQWNAAGNQFQFVGGGTNQITLDMDQGNIVTLGNVTGGYGFFNNESLTEDLRVGGIYGNLGLYVADTYDMQFAIGTTASKWKFTLANVEKFVITPNGDVTANGNLDVDGGTLNVGSSNQVNIVASGASLFPSLKVNNNGHLGSASVPTQMQLLSSGSTIFSGLVSGITPTAAANFTTKAYVDSFNPPTGTTQFFNQSSSYNNSTPGVTGYGNIVMDTSVSYYDTGKNVVIGTRGMVWTGKHYIFTDHTGNTAKFYNNNFDLITNPEASTITLPSPSSGGNVPHGAAWDGRYLYCINYSPMKIVAYDLDNGTTTATIVSETDISSYSTITYGIEYAEGHLYTCADGKVSKFKVEGKTITHVFTSGVILGTIDAQAITYDGSYLWFTQNGQNAYKVSLDCVLVATITTGLPPNNIGWAWNGQNVATVNYSTGDVYVLNTAETRFDTEEFLVMGGNVGIGTTSPAMGLHVADTKGALFGPATAASTYISPTDENTINSGYGLDEDTADVWLNYRGYQDGFTRFRDTRIGNGKGSAIVMVDGSEGHVGIGTTSPEAKLELKKQTTWGTLDNQVIYINNTGTGGNTGLLHDMGSITWRSGNVNTAAISGIRNTPGSGNNVDLRFTTATQSGGQQTSMTILSGGNVGIGTTSPTEALMVEGWIRVANNTGIKFNTSASSGDPTLNIDSSAHWNFLNTAGNNLLKIDNGGNVGIGITTPYTKLVVGSRGTAAATSILAYDGIAFDFYNDGSPYKRHGVIISQSADASESVLDFNTKAASGTNSTKMTILGNGNVGIGTSTPLAKLDIQGTQGQLFSVTDDLSGSIFAVSDISGVPIFDVNSNGKVGINTTSANDIFDVRSPSWATRIQSTTDGTYLRMSPNQIATFNSANAGSPLYINHSSSGNIIMAGGGGVVLVGATSTPFNYGGSILHIGGTRATLGLKSSGTLATIALSSNNVSDKDIHINHDGLTGALNFYQYSVTPTSARVSMFLAGNGYLGLGAGSATYPLDVHQASTSGVIIRAKGIGAMVLIESNTAGEAYLYQKPNITSDKEARFMMTAGTDYGWAWSDDGSGTPASRVKYMKLDQNPGTLTVKGDVIAYGTPSDISLKENIKPIDSALDKVMKLQGVTFDWKKTDSILELKEDIGFIAQDVQKVVPELIRENSNGLLSMRHQGVAPILLEAIKELKAEIDLLKSKPCTCNKCNCNI